jgi:phosphatidylglycerol:prolipoprotein diacylglycerol transferase
LAAFGFWRKSTGLTTFALAVALTAGIAALSFRDHALGFFELRIPTWGALLSAWLLIAWHLASRSARRLELDRLVLANACVVSAVTGLLGARLGYVAISLEEGPHLNVLGLQQGGLLGVGAVFGALGGAAWFLRSRSVSFWSWLDVSAPLLVLGMVLLRVGCYLYGCDFGVALSEPNPHFLRALGTFPRWSDPELGPVFGSAPWLEQVRRGTLESTSLDSLPVHPVQLYEACAGLLLGLLVWTLHARKQFHGQLGLITLFLYAALRFVLEAVRGDSGRGLFGPHLEPRVALPLGLLLFAAAFAYGPALSLKRARKRYAGLALGLCPAALALWATWLDRTPAQLSTTQWSALALAIGVAHFWSRLAARQGHEAASAV